MIADRIVEFALGEHDLEELLLRVGARAARPAVDSHQVAPLAQATRVRKQVPDGERSSILRQFGQMLLDPVVQPEFSVRHEQQDRGRGELLRHRPRFEDGLAGDRRSGFEVRHPPPAREQRLAVLADAGRAPRRILRPLREDPVGGRGEVSLAECQGGERNE